DAMHVMRCVDFRFSFFQIDETVSAYLAESVKHELLNKHGEDHRRLQALVMRALREKIVEGFKDNIRAIVDDLIDQMPQKGTVEFVADFANPIPSRVLGPVLGIPYEDVDGVDEWIKVGGRKVDALRSGDGIDLVEDANRNLHNYLRDMLAERRENLGSDIFSELIVAEIGGDRLSEVELVSLAGELASAGVDTTRSQLPLTLYELLAHPDQLALLQSNPELASGAVEEGMRYAPLPFALPHAALRGHTYRDITFKEGDLVMILVPATNRDPSVIEKPHTFDITRKKARHFSFGYGPHFCTGAQLARMEMSIALERLFTRIRSWRLVEEPARDPVTKGATPVELLIEIEKA
ncbi:MAG: cytochrome P450, partial [Chloroflexota bacterium]